RDRDGITLLIVVTMLALFAVVALSFVFYASAEATASRYARESRTPIRADSEPELLMSYFLSQLLYGVNDDTVGAQSALRGQDLGRNMYDYHYSQPHTHPYNGPGRLHFTITDPNNGPLNGKDDFQYPNHTWFANDGFVRDPGYYALRK